MILSNRPCTLKLLFSSAILITLCVLFFFDYPTWGDGNLKTWGSFHVPAQTCTPGSAPVAAPVTVSVISSAIPTSSVSAIPEKIWYKLGPKGLSEDSKQWIGDCLMKNPTYGFEALTDDTGELYVKKYYTSRPDIVETYLAIPIPILKSDFLRWLILYNDGGVWSDLDVSCEEIPMQEWIPAQYKGETGLVVGLEFDWAWENDKFLHSQFASWTVMAKPMSPHMLMIIEDILEDFRQKCKEHSIKLTDLKLDMVGHVVDLTGPKRMTRSIVKSLELILNDTIDDRYGQISLSAWPWCTSSQLSGPFSSLPPGLCQQCHC
jgi:mannosyltransferase OCH1-like enzyme